MAETRGRQAKKGWLGIGIDYDIFNFSAYAYDYGTGTVVDGSWGEKFEGLGRACVVSKECACGDVTECPE